MNTFAGTGRLLCRNIQRSCMITHNKTPVRTCIFRRNFVIGLVPLIPSVYAQSEIKSDSSVVNKPAIEEHKVSTQDENASQLENDDGWERLRAIFKKDEFGKLSKEMSAVTQSMCLACFIGFIYGGVEKSRIAFRDFMERNQASIFENHLDAKRRLQNHVTIHFGKGAIKWAIRLTLFTGGFTLFLATMTAYRGRSSVLDYALSGALVGGLLRFRLGPPAMVVGGALGGFLGLVCGLTTYGLLNVFDTNIDEIIAFQYEVDRKRHQLFLEGEKKAFESSMNNCEAVVLFNDREIEKDSKEL